jgi:hypothetical protein
VFAAADGRVIDAKAGYVNAAEFLNRTQQVLAALSAGPGGAGLQLTGAQKVMPAGDRAGQARALLALAEDEFRTQQYVACLLRCKSVAAAFPDLPEAESARQLALKLKSDPERMRAVCDGLTQSLCELYLEQAGAMIQAGQRDQAVPYLLWVTQACPNTPTAAAAQQLLKQAAPAVNGPTGSGKFTP